MPSCSEKSIICLLYYLSLKLISNPIALDNNIVQKEFEYLKERLKIEELESKEIRNLLEEISINIKYENWKHSLISMKKIFKKISPLNIHELFRLIKKVNNTAHTIKNKDIIFFLGGTGSGKSTTIHFLAGSKMIENKVTGLNHLSLVEINNPDLKHITTSPFARSETRYITSVKVNFDDVGGFTSESIILCDSPGFEDTSGPEVDIANGLGIVNGIKGCKSVKPVVIISYKSIGDRLQGLKDLMYVLSALIPGIQDQIEAFSYIFTKFPEKERDTIHALINDINENLKEEEKSDRSFTILLKDILKKTRKCARVLDPINDKPGKILDELAKSPAIHHPEEVFQFSITKKSKAILREQITKHQLNIRSATERSDYDFVKYRLDQLKHLNDLFSQDYIEQIYNDCLRYISRHLFEEYEKGILAMKRYLMNQTSLNAEDIRQYQACMYHAKLAKEVRENHLGMEVVDSTAFIENLNQQLNMILKDLREKDIADMSIKVSLDKLKIVSNTFLDIDSKKYDDICQFFIEKLDSLVDLFKISVSSNKFDQSAIHITKLYRAITVLQDHLDQKEIKVKYMQLKEYFLNYLNDSVGKLNPIFTQMKYIYEARRDVENLLKILFRREEKVNYDNLRKSLLNLKRVEWIEKYRTGIYSDVINKAEEQIIQHVKQLKDAVMEIKIDLENHDQIEHVYKLISQINAIKCMEKLVPDVIRDIDEINSWFKGVTNNIFVIIKDTFNIEKWKEHKYQSLDFNKLEKGLNYLDACKKIYLLFMSNCICVVNDLEEFIRYFSNYVQQEMKSYFKSIIYYQNENKKEIFEKAQILSSRLQELSEIKTKYSRVFSCFSNKKIIEQWQNDLCHYLIELSDEMEKITITKQINILNNKLIIVKALSTLDRFLKGEKFIDIYNKYQNIFFIEVNDAHKQIIDAIRNTDYERVAFEIVTLHSSNEIGEYFYQKAKRMINNGLNDLMEETKTQTIMLGNNIEIKGIKSIVENLKRIYRAQKSVSEHLNEPAELDKCVIDVKNFLEEQIIRFLEGVKALININDFCKVDEKLDLITVVCHLLGKYCTEKVLNSIKEVKHSQYIVLSKDLVEKYSNMDIRDYYLNPPTDIFAKFAQVNHTNPLYNEALIRIKNIIVTKLREELKQAILEEPPNLENNHIRRFESAVKCLPETMRIALEVELKHCKDDINQLIQDNNNKLNIIFRSEDLESTKTMLENYQNLKGMQSVVNNRQKRLNLYKLSIMKIR
ncbi:unnamed protein product [Rotaria sp. Silwood2]|nr:unnamed protein product [Rotaria sp. Silwood2]